MVTGYKHKYKQLAYGQTELLQRFLLSLLHSLTASSMVIFLMSFFKEHVYFMVDIHSCGAPIHSFSGYCLRSYYAGTGSTSKNRQMPCPSVTKPSCSQRAGPGVSGSWIVDRTSPPAYSLSPHVLYTRLGRSQRKQGTDGKSTKRHINFLQMWTQLSHPIHHIPSLDTTLSVLPIKSLTPNKWPRKPLWDQPHLAPGTNRPFVPPFSLGLVAIFGAVQCYQHDQKQQ